MKKKIFIPLIIAVLLLVIGAIYFINKPYYSVTIDINPSIKIDMDKNDKVKRIKPLNADAKKVIKGIENGDSLKNTINTIVKSAVENDFIKNNNLVILMHSTKDIDKDEIERNIAKDLDNYSIEVIRIENITIADELYARRNGISPAKAAYINEIINENKEIDKELLIDKSINELKETEETGRYCDEGYSLQGESCIKEISREPAKKGMICDAGYRIHNDKCYLEDMPYETGNLICPNKEFELDGSLCSRTLTEKANPNYECDKGELMKKGDVNPIGSKDNDNYYCIDKSTGKKPTLRCLKNPGHIIINGKCYNGPAPLINGGCPGNDIVRNGGCYSLDNEDQWECPNGNIYHVSQNSVPELCPDTLTYITPKIKGYSCNEGYTLEGTKCIRKEQEDSTKEMACKSGYTLVNNDTCLNYNDVKDIKEGYYCDKENSIVEESICILRDIKEAKIGR